MKATSETGAASAPNHANRCGQAEAAALYISLVMAAVVATHTVWNFSQNRRLGELEWRVAQIETCGKPPPWTNIWTHGTIKLNGVEFTNIVVVRDAFGNWTVRWPTNRADAKPSAPEP